MNWLRANWLRVLVHAGALAPLGVIILDNYRYNLTANPIQEITVRTGKAALVLLVLSLACTPLNTVFGFRQALQVRRALGLYGFMYAALHLAIFAVLDYGLDLQLIGQAIVEKYYVIAGFVAFLILVPLAITSTRGWMARLGKRWKSLHKLVYLAVPVAVLHFALLVKSLSSRPEPLIFGAVVIMLLALRIPVIRRASSKLRFKNAPFRPKRVPGSAD
ncbi:MAG: protein-methionine-sulfoxide reductase heme-binding subunit MsrQ [Anaerolineae bacterium]|nr:sulfoxide reductase heme-binding subunit YedZ [Candidatus Roseilinea sp.]MDW8450346.1 protein-methionine-sulfoxide reductase heme-binding subunit MsrQ [Anaerolineae bacterium]